MSETGTTRSHRSGHPLPERMDVSGLMRLRPTRPQSAAHVHQPPCPDTHSEDTTASSSVIEAKRTAHLAPLAHVSPGVAGPIGNASVGQAGCSRLDMNTNNQSQNPESIESERTISADDVEAALSRRRTAAGTRYVRLATRDPDRDSERSLLLDTETDAVAIVRHVPDTQDPVQSRAAFEDLVPVHDPDVADLGVTMNEDADIAYAEAVLTVILEHPECVDYIGKSWFSFAPPGPRASGVRTIFLDPGDEDGEPRELTEFDEDEVTDE